MAVAAIEYERRRSHRRDTLYAIAVVVLVLLAPTLWYVGSDQYAPLGEVVYTRLVGAHSVQWYASRPHERAAVERYCRKYGERPFTHRLDCDNIQRLTADEMAARGARDEAAHWPLRR